MEETRHSCRIISLYSPTYRAGRKEHAINLAAAFGSVTDSTVLFIDISKTAEKIDKMLKLDAAGSDGTVITSKIGVDVLIMEHIEKQWLDRVINKYRYTVIDLPSETSEAVFDIFSLSDAVYFLSDSIVESLERTHKVMDDLFNIGMKDMHKKVKIIINRLNIFDKLSVEEMSWLLKKEIWAIVPEPGILDELIDIEGRPLVLKSKFSEYSKATLRIAKSETGKILGLALGSGAAFGLAHIGVLRVLEQNHITVDIISGSSMGALIGTLWGLGFSSDKIEYIARKLKNRLHLMRLLDFTVPISGILAGKRLKRFLTAILHEKTFEDLLIPVKIMVYDLSNREVFSIEKGSLVEAVYMSIAVPGIFKPIIEKDRMIIDGGVSDPVPVDILVKEGVKKIIAVNVLPGPQEILERNMYLKKAAQEEENIMHTGSFYTRSRVRLRKFLRKIFIPNIFDVIMSSMQSIEYMLAENSCKKADVVLHPVFADATSIDFHLVGNFIEEGEKETALYINEIKALALR